MRRRSPHGVEESKQDGDGSAFALNMTRKLGEVSGSGEGSGDWVGLGLVEGVGRGGCVWCGCLDLPMYHCFPVTVGGVVVGKSHARTVEV